MPVIIRHLAHTFKSHFHRFTRFTVPGSIFCVLWFETKEISQSASPAAGESRIGLLQEGRPSPLVTPLPPMHWSRHQWITHEEICHTPGGLASCNYYFVASYMLPNCNVIATLHAMCIVVFLAEVFNGCLQNIQLLM